MTPATAPSTTRPRRRLHLFGLVLALFALVGQACTATGGAERIEVNAVFDDVYDLVRFAQVRAGDVAIGGVEEISLTEDNRALVRMSIRSDTGLTMGTKAVISRTTLLGERYIDLRPITNDSGQLVDDAPLTDGATLAITDDVDDLEQLVVSGAGLLSIIAADKLAAAVETGANAFGGRGSALGNLLDSIQGAVGRYNEDADAVTDLIDSLDRLTGRLAPVAEENAGYLADMLAASRALQAEDDRLLDTLDDVTRLSLVGARVLGDNAGELDNLIRRLRLILNEVTRVDGGLQTLLTWLPVHNANVPNGAIAEKAQVWLDFILCDFNDDKDDPSESCDPPNPGERAERPDNAPEPSDTDTTPPEPVSGDEPENQQGGAQR